MELELSPVKELLVFWTGILHLETVRPGTNPALPCSPQATGMKLSDLEGRTGFSPVRNLWTCLIRRCRHSYTRWILPEAVQSTR